MTHTIAMAEAQGQGVTAVITHRVRTDHHAAYETWLDEISPLCRQSTGCLDWHLLRPLEGITATYTIIVRFDTREHLLAWMTSPVRTRLIDRVRPLLVAGDDFFINSGFDFWFAPAGAKAQVPVRWKQFLVTWSVIYPLVLIVPPVVLPALRGSGIPQNVFLDTVVVTGSVVVLVVFVIMPHYTRLITRWLFA